ncbi:Transmembrane and immunoglobulin domain-containing protein 2 [Chelonia mydas]|nr:Transmembrane and immunoglobulin domain-containing protein 2 [Chelonia mydas]
MQRLGGCLLLLLLAARKEAGTLQVRQDPAQILAPLGGSVELSCQIDAAQHWERLRVEWRREGALRALCQVVLDNTSVSNCCKGMEGCDDARLGFTWHPPKFTLRMGNISKDDVGQYMCVATVEIPVYLQATGNGTMLNTSGVHREQRELLGAKIVSSWGTHLSTWVTKTIPQNTQPPHMAYGGRGNGSCRALSAGVSPPHPCIASALTPPALRGLGQAHHVGAGPISPHPPPHQIMAPLPY